MFNLQYVKMYALETNQLSYGNCSLVPKEVAAIIFLKDFIFVFILSSRIAWLRIYEPVSIAMASLWRTLESHRHHFHLCLLPLKSNCWLIAQLCIDVNLLILTKVLMWTHAQYVYMCVQYVYMCTICVHVCAPGSNQLSYGNCSAVP